MPGSHDDDAPRRLPRKEIDDTKPTPQGLCALARRLGYKDPFSQLIYPDGSVVGDLLEFFEDNPGACEAVVEWVLDEYGTDEEEDDEDDDENDEGE